jgi:hypothetical protein
LFKEKFDAFFKSSDFIVCPIRGSGRIEKSEQRKKPRIEIKDYASFVSVKLAKLGYYGGNPDSILNAPIDIVVNILHYEQYEQDYEGAYIELNAEGDS